MTWDELPIEIKLAMSLNQVLQWNPHSQEPFERSVKAGKYMGGFKWKESIEGKTFWKKVLLDEYINHFYTKYPKSQVEADGGDMEGNPITEAAQVITDKINENKEKIKALKAALKILNE